MPPNPVRRPEIWLGDLVRTVHALRADAATTEQIRELLGLDGSAAPTAPPAPPAPLFAVPPPGPPPGPVPQPTPFPSARDVQPPDDAPRRTRVTETPVLTVTAIAPTAPPHVPDRIDAVLGPTTGDAARTSETLLAPGRTRSLLTAVCSGPAVTDEIDVDATVERLARGRPADPPPLRIRHTTRRGLQVLVDRGHAMLPFLDDETAVLATIARVAGTDGVRVLRFAGTPLDAPGAGPGPLPTWLPYRAPLAGTPVLALTDLGLIGSDARDRRAGWLRFAARLREARCPFVALVPIPAHRIPATVRAAVAVVTWDRGTSIRDATAAARRAARDTRAVGRS